MTSPQGLDARRAAAADDRQRPYPFRPTGDHVHVLLAAGAFNSLTQRVHAELRDHGHHVSFELALSATSWPRPSAATGRTSSWRRC